ncbi:MAG: hypothetical protein U5K31_13520 [Balneolaceae bacterium]|nr:hypothetical protein [Balneolaceae bacterium]
MKKLLVILAGFLLIGAEQGIAQTQGDLTVEQLRDYVSDQGVYQTRISRNVRGTPYLNADWLRGHLTLADGQQSQPIMMRLNTYEQEVEFVRDEEVLVIPPSSLSGLVIYNNFGNITFENGYRSEEYEITEDYLLRVLHDNRTKLLVEHVTVLQKDMASYGTASRQDEYIDNRNIFFVSADGSWEEIRLRKRDILNQLDSHRSEIEEFVKQNNLDYSEEQEVVRILQHYDSLLQNESGSGN